MLEALSENPNTLTQNIAPKQSYPHRSITSSWVTGIIYILLILPQSCQKEMP